MVTGNGVAHRKKLIFSVGLLFLPDTAFGMETELQELEEGITNPEKSKQKLSTVRKPDQTETSRKTRNKREERHSLPSALDPTFLWNTSNFQVSSEQRTSAKAFKRKTHNLSKTASSEANQSKNLPSQSNQPSLIGKLKMHFSSEPQSDELNSKVTELPLLQTRTPEVIIKDPTPRGIQVIAPKKATDNKPPKVKAKDFNDAFSKSFNKMREYSNYNMTGKSLTPLESERLKFYVKKMEIDSVQFMSLDPDLDDTIQIQPGILAIFPSVPSVESDLCCQITGEKEIKIIKRNGDPTLLGYEEDSYERVLSAQKFLSESNPSINEDQMPSIIVGKEQLDMKRYIAAFLWNREEQNRSPIAHVEEALAQLDRERLFRYLALCNYFPTLKEIRPWPRIDGDKIEDITGDILSKFWNLDFAELLKTPNHSAIISKDSLEKIIASAIHFAEIYKALKVEKQNQINQISEQLQTIKEKNQIKKINDSIKKLEEDIAKTEETIMALYHTLRDCYSELSKRDLADEEYHIHSARYLTETNCYKEAWRHILQGEQTLSKLEADDETIKWLKTLQINHFSNVIQSIQSTQSISALEKANEFLKIARFAQTVSILDNKNYKKKKAEQNELILELDADDRPDLDAVNYFVEALKYFYETNEQCENNKKIALNEINQLDPDMLFHVICKAYDAAQYGKKAELFLGISQDCLSVLRGKRSKLVHGVHDSIAAVIGSTYAPKTKELPDRMLLSDSIQKESFNLLQQRVKILFSLGDMVRGVDNQNKDASALYGSAVNLFYYIEASSDKCSAKTECSKRPQEIIESALESCIRMGSPVADKSLADKIIKELYSILVDKKHKTDVYLSALGHFKKNELWVTAFNLARSTLPSLISESKQTEFEQFKEGIEEPFYAVQGRKEQLNRQLFEMISIIIESKKISKNISEEQIENWTDHCHLITGDQLKLLIKNINYLEQNYVYLDMKKEKERREEEENGAEATKQVANFNFDNLEERDYMKGLYESFGLTTLPIEEWFPDKYVKLEQPFQDSPQPRDQMSLDSSESTDQNAMEVKKLEHQLEEERQKNKQRIKEAILNLHKTGQQFDYAKMFSLSEDEVKEMLQ